MIRTPKRGWMAVGAIVAWIWFVLACVSPPAWSPDGSKLLFTYINHESKRAGIGLLDVQTGEVVSLHEVYAHNTFLHAQWAKDGKRVIIVQTGDDKGTQEKGAVYIVFPGEEPRKVPIAFVENPAPYAPYVEADGKLLLPMAGHLFSLDLQSGEMSELKLDGSVPCLYDAGARVTYVRDSEVKIRKKDFGVVEFGDFEPHSLKFIKRSTFVWSRTKLHGEKVEEIDSCGAPDPAGRRAAVPFHTKTHRGIAVLNDGRVDKFEIPDDTPAIAMAWAADGESLYMTCLSAQGNGTLYEVVELDLSGKVLRRIPVTTFALEPKDLNDWLHMSLSPDGKTLAMPTTTVIKEATGATGQAIFLVDVKAERVKTIPVRLPMKAMR